MFEIRDKFFSILFGNFCYKFTELCVKLRINNNSMFYPVKRILHIYGSFDKCLYLSIDTIHVVSMCAHGNPILCEGSSHIQDTSSHQHIEPSSVVPMHFHHFHKRLTFLDRCIPQEGCLNQFHRPNTENR